ncbi:MAG: hypothetical protein LBR89_04595 [Holosporales bacterium]|jgi:hypothetical protein|nr:hypothetical protein [Holosporales bacterium]
MLKKTTKNFYLWTSLFVASVPMYASAPDTILEQAEASAEPNANSVPVQPAWPDVFSPYNPQGTPPPELQQCTPKTPFDDLLNNPGRWLFPFESSFQNDIISQVNQWVRVNVQNGKKQKHNKSPVRRSSDLCVISVSPHLVNSLINAVKDITLGSSAYVSNTREFERFKTLRLFNTPVIAADGTHGFGSGYCQLYSYHNEVRLLFMPNPGATLLNDIIAERAKFITEHNAKLRIAVEAEFREIATIWTTPIRELIARAKADPLILGSWGPEIEAMMNAAISVNAECSFIQAQAQELAQIQSEVLPGIETLLAHLQMPYIRAQCNTADSGWTRITNSRDVLREELANERIVVCLTLPAYIAFAERLGARDTLLNEEEMHAFTINPLINLVGRILALCDSCETRINSVIARIYELQRQITEFSSRNLTKDKLSTITAMINVYISSKNKGEVNPEFKSEFKRAATSHGIMSLTEFAHRGSMAQAQQEVALLTELRERFRSVQALIPGAYKGFDTYPRNTLAAPGAIPEGSVLLAFTPSDSLPDQEPSDA